MGASGPLLLLLVLARSGSVLAKVVRDFQECGGFFQDGVPPQGFENSGLVRICQRYKNQYHFATLYRTELRIPVYSAYRYPCSLGESSAYRPALWFHEPQIDDPNFLDEMTDKISSLGEWQALNSDYKGEGYERGHIYPFRLNNKTSATSSCTLTNAVPMTPLANKKWYREVEAMVARMASMCHSSNRSMYLVTGPANPTEKKLKNRVSVPRSVWTTLCCTFPQDQNNDPCQTSPPSEGSVWEGEAPFDKDFSFAFMKDLEPEAKAEYLTVTEVQHRLGVGAIFNNCGIGSPDEGETFKEIEGLINQIKMSIGDQELAEDNFPQTSENCHAPDSDSLAIEQAETLLEPVSEEGNEAVCQSIVTNVWAPFGTFASAAMTFAQLIAAVLRIIRVLAVTSLIIPFWIIYNSASCLIIMAKYLIVTVFSVPGDLVSVVVSVASDTVSAISCVGRLIKSLIRIL
ncbi:endonuclease domain-containing 1 protein-like [Narcine bancroftii]|uniref:endonuclease domain-containing 1 protein-like n=1 Tax=Narcine bancroftii TaxID=1343680 RepID=UPI003831BC6D